MSSAVPERHPDQDQLADLAAEVLPLDVARSVEAHVMGCTFCERLLADAERVRHLIFTEDPGPMPDDVWRRMEGILAAEAASRRRPSGRTAPHEAPNWFDGQAAAPGAQGGADGRGAPATGAFPAADPPVGPQSLYPAGPATPYSSPTTGRGAPLPPAPPPSMSFDEAPTAAWKAFLDEPEPSPPTAPVPLRVGRAVRSSVRSRRDVRTEDREADRRSRMWLPAVAAAVVLLLAGGIGTVLLLRGGGGADPVTADIPGPAHGVVSHSGREYTAATLVTQVRALLANPSATVRPSGSPVQASRSLPAKGTVADPERLQSCLQGLGEHDRHPLAVDLARYQGREAAIIVLPGRTRGFDVWVVPQQCTFGAESPLAFKSVPS